MVSLMIYTRAGSVNVAVFRREWRGERREEKPMNQTIFRFTLCAVLFAVSFPPRRSSRGKSRELEFFFLILRL